MLREAIAFGIEPVTAFRMATLTALSGSVCMIAARLCPDGGADLIVFDDLRAPSPTQVYAGGRLRAEGGRLLDDAHFDMAPVPAAVSSSVNVAWDAFDLRIPAAGALVRVIGSLQDQLLTEERILEARIEVGQAVADPARDILKMAVVDRHTASGSMGLGFIPGLRSATRGHRRHGRPRPSQSGRHRRG